MLRNPGESTEGANKLQKHTKSCKKVPTVTKNVRKGCQTEPKTLQKNPLLKSMDWYANVGAFRDPFLDQSSINIQKNTIQQIINESIATKTWNNTKEYQNGNKIDAQSMLKQEAHNIMFFWSQHRWSTDAESRLEQMMPK